MNVSKIKSYCKEMWTYASRENGMAIIPLKSFYQEGVQNPTLATMIKFDEFKNLEIKEEEKIINALRKYIITQEESRMRFAKIKNAPNFISQLESNPEIKPLYDKFLTKFNKAYPKTGALRMKLLELCRVNLEEITPKAGFIKKFIIKTLTKI